VSGYRFSGEVLVEAQRHGVKGAWSDDHGNYKCFTCGARWEAENILSWWPIALRWRAGQSGFFSRHLVEVGTDGIERPIWKQVFRIGALRIVAGVAPRKGE